MKQRVDITPPASPIGAPIAVFFHGGVWQLGDKRDYGLVGRALAAEGFVAVVASYRLAPAHPWPAQAEDAAAAVALALREGARLGADTRRLVLVGHSAGAQMAAMLAYDARFLGAVGRSPRDVAALALLSGVFDLRAPLDESRADGGFAQFVAPAFPGNAAALAAASPLRVAHALSRPLLLVTSEHDYGAMREQTMAMDKRLRALGDRPELLVLPGVDHFGIVSSMDAPDVPTARHIAQLVAPGAAGTAGTRDTGAAPTAAP